MNESLPCAAADRQCPIDDCPYVIPGKTERAFFANKQQHFSRRHPQELQISSATGRDHARLARAQRRIRAAAGQKNVVDMIVGPRNASGHIDTKSAIARLYESGAFAGRRPARTS